MMDVGAVSVVCPSVRSRYYGTTSTPPHSPHLLFLLPLFLCYIIIIQDRLMQSILQQTQKRSESAGEWETIRSLLEHRSESSKM